MNNKHGIYKMLLKSLNEEKTIKSSPDKTAETPTSPETPKEQPVDLKSDEGGFEPTSPEMAPPDSSEPAFGSSNSELESNKSDDSVSGEEKDIPPAQKEPEKEENPIEKNFDEFKNLATSSDDSYDFLKFLKVKMLEMKDDDFNKFLSKIVKDKELKSKRSVIDSLIKLKNFLLLNY